MSDETQPQTPEAPPPPMPHRSARRLFLWISLLFILFTLALTAIGVGIWFWQILDGPVAKGDFEATVIIRRGSGYNAIVKQLHQAGLLPYPKVFDYLAWRRGDAAKWRPGRYRFQSRVSARQIYEQLLVGSPIKLTVPEGWTLVQIAKRLADEQLTSGTARLLALTSDPEFLRRHGIPAANAEGYVLPETYHFDPGVTVREMADEMIGSHARQYAEWIARPRPESLTWHQALTLGSMIEREARNETEMPVIASVYYNRLRKKMTLDCDATIRYALSKWDAPLTKDDLKTSSPYNTYTRRGLPPGPIGCAGRPALQAALEPAQTDYLFYVYKGDNSHHFSRTLREHHEAVRKYLRKDLTPTRPQE